MDNAVKLYAWHFMAWPHLPADFDERYASGWVTVPNSLYDREKAQGRADASTFRRRTTRRPDCDAA